MQIKNFLKVNNYLLSIVVSFILLNLVFYYISSTNITTNYEEILKLSTDQEILAVEDFFRYPENIINILSQNKDLPKYEGGNKLLRLELLSLFQSIIVPDSRISNIYFVSYKGEVISYKFVNKKGVNFPQTVWFQKAIEGEKQFTWTSHRSDFSNDDVISCTRRIVDKYDNPIGVVGLDIELFKLSSLVKYTDMGKNSYFMILDEKNKIIASPNHKYLGQTIFYDTTNSKDDMSINLKIKNENVKCKIAKVGKLPWKILTVVPVNKISASIRFFVVLFFIFSLASCIIVSILININRKLKGHASIIEELAVSRERSRLAMDIHDTLGHTMTILISMLDTIHINFENGGKIKKDLIKTTEIARNGLQELRRSILGLTAQKYGTTSLLRSLRSLISEYEQSGVNIDFSLDGELNIKDPAYFEVIYRSCQEAMTNALRHGNATQITIIFQVTTNCIKLFIFDDGKGCKNIKKGFGLSGMEQRIKSLKGNIIYGSSGEKGFNINIELPIKGKGI